MIHILAGYAAFDERIPDHRNCIRWQDDLTAGPVPATETLEKLTAVRETFWRDAFALWRMRDRDVVAFDPPLAGRDEQLRRLSDSGESVMWFGPNRREMLMVSVLLHFLDAPPAAVRCPQWNIMTYNPDQLVGFFDARAPVTPEFVSAAAELWRAYTSPDSAGLAALARVDDAGFEAVLASVSAEYPAVHNGLSETEENLLRNSGEGRRALYVIGKTMADTEDMPSDVPMISRLWEFLTAEAPLLEAPGQSLADVDCWDAFRKLVVRPTALGTRLLDGEADYVELCGVDRWIGGVHLQGHAVPWRFDRVPRRLVSD
jgi:hypothetical protein